MSKGTDLRTMKRPSRPLLVFGLIAIHIGIAGLLLFRSQQLYGSDGVRRYTEIASKSGTPYRDFDVEFAPADLAVIELAASVDVETTYRRIVAIMLIVDMSCAAALMYGWGARAATVYLLLTAPILLILYLGTDLTWVMLATLAFSLVHRGHERSGGAALALATLGKVWPIVLVPLLIVTQKKRAVGAFLFVGLIGTLLWVAIGGIGAPAQVLTFRGAHGWEFESLIGAFVWIVGRHQPVLEQGAPRVGAISSLDRFLLSAIVVGGIAVIAQRARTWKGSVAGGPALACVALLLCASPIFSLEYATWLIPWAAIAATDDPGTAYALVVAAIETATGILATIYVAFNAETVTKVLLVMRNGLCLAIALAWLVGMPKHAFQGQDPAQEAPTRSDLP
jgi:hypothetical protein